MYKNLIAKYFLPCLHRDKTTKFASISARVGSIEDNELGGWYSYRASKSALNMILKGLSIEQKRSNKNSIIFGLHPGTVNSKLSRPFQKKDKEYFSPEFSANKLIKVIDKFGLSDVEELLIEIGKGNIKSRDVLNFLYPEKANSKNKLPILKKPQLQESMKIKGVISGMAIHYAHYCHPLPGERIVGIVTTGKGITVHALDCFALEKFKIGRAHV